MSKNGLSVIDLRSDTVTLPTPGMRRAMAQAEVGDDVFGEDPTVKRLEQRTAALLGKAAGLFVASGTMGNQLAVRTHTEPGQEIILDANSHIYYFEGGGPAAFSGVMCRCLAGHRGIFTAQEVASVLRKPDPHFAPTRLICIENTHNRGGGSIWPLENIHAIAALARDRGLKLHLDGARLWNASIASGIPERDFATPFDSVNVCFSKGLGAPVGSVLAGSVDFIERARRFRKQIGGGMRQAGIIAAGALYALDHHRARLAEDHRHARLLAQGLNEISGLSVDLDQVRTNLVMLQVHCGPAEELVKRLAALGVLVLSTGPDSIRAVPHLGITTADIRLGLQRFAKAATAMSCGKAKVAARKNGPAQAVPLQPVARN